MVKEDLCFLQGKDTLNYIAIMNEQINSVKVKKCSTGNLKEGASLLFDNYFPSDFKSLLYSMLLFNLYFRMSAKECLKNDCFHHLKNNKFNKLSFEKIKLEVDSDEAFDYTEGSSKLFSLKDYMDII